MKKASKKQKARKITEDGDGPPPVKRTADGLDTAYFIAEAALNEQPEPTSPAPAEEPPAPAAVPPPLAPLAALWPTPVAPQVESKSAQAPAPQVQAAPVAASAPKASPAPASLPPKSPGQSTSPTAPLKAAASAQAANPAPPKTVSISFALVKPDAKHVSLSGDFNGWSPGAMPLKRRHDGLWETTVALAPGRYQYKFLVDGVWSLDPAAQKNVPNEYGSLNSVIEVQA